MERAAKPLAVAATIGMFIVLLMGATVTNTGSGEGCGDSWPLCHGEFIPEYAFETMVEYSHRLVTGVEGLLILGLSITAFPLRRRYPELKALIPVMVFTLLLQSGMGAWAVKSPQTPPVMASHFGISLVCFASVFLVMRVLWETTPVTEEAARAVPAGYRTLAWAALLWSVVVAYVGAYMRHSGAELACYTWPLCNGSLFPDLSSPGIAAAWGHRLAAVVALVLVAWLELWSRRFKAATPGPVPHQRLGLGLHRRPGARRRLRRPLPAEPGQHAAPRRPDGPLLRRPRRWGEADDAAAARYGDASANRDRSRPSPGSLTPIPLQRLARISSGVAMVTPNAAKISSRLESRSLRS